MRSIQLKTSDNQMVEISEAAAMQIEVLKNNLEDCSSDSAEIVIPVRNVTAETMRRVIQWVVKKQEAAADPTEEEGFREWEKRFVDTIQLNDLYELINAADYLSINALLHRGCQKIADMIAGKTPEKIREIFGIPNDFTPEEEAELRKQNAWEFEPNPQTQTDAGSTSAGSTDASNTNQ